MTTTYDAIIVGGGHNGLVAAGYLARAGLRTLVLERRHIVGGPAGSVDYFPGYRAAISNSPGSLEPKIVLELELEKHGLRFAKPNPSVLVPFDDGRAFVGWRERDRLVLELLKFSKRDSTAYYEFNQYLEDFARTLAVNLFEPPPTLRELTARLETPEHEEIFAKFMFGSLKELLDEWFESEEVKAVLGLTALLTNMSGPSAPGTALRFLQRPMSLMSSELTADHDPRKQELRGATGQPYGGMGAVPEAMARSIVAAGGTIRTNADVVHVLVDQAGSHGVVLATGEEIASPIVLSNLNPKTTFLKLVDAEWLNPEFRTKIENINMRGSAFKIGLALDGLPVLRSARDAEEARVFAGSQVRIAPSLEYMERAVDDAKYGRWSERPLIWALTPSVYDPNLAPPGKHVMSINVFHAPFRLKTGTWKVERDRFGNRSIDVLTEFMPNLKDVIREVRFWSPEDLADEFGLVEANITHGDLMPAHWFSFRPMSGWSSYRTPIHGLYLCGSGVWPGGLVSGLVGHNASHKVLQDLRSGYLAASSMSRA